MDAKAIIVYSKDGKLETSLIVKEDGLVHVSITGGAGSRTMRSAMQDAAADGINVVGDLIEVAFNA